jgi:hypothetical protein
LEAGWPTVLRAGGATVLQAGWTAVLQAGWTAVLQARGATVLQAGWTAVLAAGSARSRLGYTDAANECSTDARRKRGDRGTPTSPRAHWSLISWELPGVAGCHVRLPEGSR